MRGLLQSLAWMSALSFAPAAQAERLAVVSLAVTGEVAAADVASVDQAIAEGLRRSGHEVLPPSDARAVIDGRSPGCVDSRRISCMAAELRAVGWPVFVSGRILREAPSIQTEIDLEAYDVTTGRQIAEETGTTTASDGSVLLALAQSVSQSLARKIAAATRTAHLSVDSEPTGAAIRLGDRLLGRTPWAGEVAPGHAVLHLDLEGRARQSRDLELAPGQNERVSVMLMPSGGVASPGRRRAAWQVPAGVAMLVAGAALAGAGLYGLVREGCVERFADGPCAEELTGTYRGVFGGVSLALGIALGTAGVLTAFVVSLGDANANASVQH